jgi:hypothetical protein
MNDANDHAVSQSLASALSEFGLFLQPDDLKRGEAIERADTETLAAMIETVAPL